MKRLYVLTTDIARARAAGAVEATAIDSERPLCVRIEPFQDLRTNLMNRLYWARLTEIADQWRDGNTYYTEDGLHEAFAEALLPKKEIETPTGKKLIRKSTTELTVAEFSDYMERIAAWAADKGITFSE